MSDIPFKKSAGHFGGEEMEAAKTPLNISSKPDISPAERTDLGEIYHLARWPSEKLPRAFKTVVSAMRAAAEEINLPIDMINWEQQGENVWLARNGQQMIAIQKISLES